MAPTNHLHTFEGSALLNCDAKHELVYVLQHPEAGRSGYQAQTSLSNKSVCACAHFSGQTCQKTMITARSGPKRRTFRDPTYQLGTSTMHMRLSQEIVCSYLCVSLPN